MDAFFSSSSVLSVAFCSNPNGMERFTADQKSTIGSHQSSMKSLTGGNGGNRGGRFLFIFLRSLRYLLFKSKWDGAFHRRSEINNRQSSIVNESCMEDIGTANLANLANQMKS